MYKRQFYCWGQLLVVLLSTGALALFGEWIWKYLPLFWAVVPLLNFFLFLKTPLVIPDQEKENRLRTALRTLFSSPVFYLMLLMMLCAGACELAMAQWASYFAEAALGTTKLLGEDVYKRQLVLRGALGNAEHLVIISLISHMFIPLGGNASGSSGAFPSSYLS